MTALWGGGEGVEGVSKKEKGLTDMGHSVMIVGGRVEVEEGIRGINSHGKCKKI